MVMFGDSDPAGTVAPRETVSLDVWLVVCGGALGCVTSVPPVVCGEVEGGGEDDALPEVTPVVIWRADVGGVLLVVVAPVDKLTSFFVVSSELVVFAAVVDSSFSAAEEAEEQTV